MYEITYKIMNGQEVVGYELSDGSPKNKLLSVEQTQGLAIAGMIRNVEYSYKTKRLHGINGNDLRKLAKKQYKIKSRKITKSNIYTGNELLQLVNNSTHGYKERFIIDKLRKFLETACLSSKVCKFFTPRKMVVGCKWRLEWNKVSRLADF